LSEIPGKCVIKREFKRESERPLKEIKEEVSALFAFPDWKKFLELNFAQFNRYIRDQALDALKRFQNREIEQVIFAKATEFCIQNQTVSMAELDDTYKYYLEQHLEARDMLTPEDLQIPEPVSKPKPALEVKRRNFAVYKKIISNRRDVKSYSKKRGSGGSKSTIVCISQIVLKYNFVRRYFSSRHC